MCEFELELNITQSKYGLEQLSILNQRAKIRFGEISYGKCLECGLPLPESFMHQFGKCSKSLCELCYSTMFLAKAQTRYIDSCYVCKGQRGPLPKHQVERIRGNPRETKEHIHKGVCKDIFTLAHCTVTGAFQPPAIQVPTTQRQIPKPEPVYQLVAGEPPLRLSEFSNEDIEIVYLNPKGTTI